MAQVRDTIFAVATGQGQSAIAVIRLSGPEAWSYVETLTGKSAPVPRRLVRRSLVDRFGLTLDDAMLIVFEDGASFTGERSAEIHCHGGRAVVDAILEELSRLGHSRLAEPGEFTRRAFEAGRMDLTEVEGLADLIAAETEFQRKQAIRVSTGQATSKLEDWRSRLIRARALIEVTIDWADEEVPEDVSPEVADLLSGVRGEIAQELKQFARTERLREGFEVALIGPPNVGKSSLLNAIAGRDVAIVSDIAGTTRDVLEVRCNLGGIPVTFLDTAGLRAAADDIERIGVERALARAQAADVRVRLRASDVAETDAHDDVPADLVIWSKCDLDRGDADHFVSAVTGEGIEDFLSSIRARLERHASGVGLFGHARQRDALQKCHDAIVRAQAKTGTSDPEVLADDLRSAVAALDALSGRSSVEDVLGDVFASFCLGK
ncbi:MAG: tRNA uridine-5-carboxymethylaminomethyl(34) synthesis GTPase MnmE [Pseudomonadota bacterium]